MSDDDKYTMLILLVAALAFFAWGAAPAIDAWGEEPVAERPVCPDIRDTADRHLEIYRHVSGC